jgi:uncharacterized protein (TIGR03067 family)
MLGTDEPPPANDEGDEVAREIATLQGTWEQVALEADGVTDPPDAYTGPGVSCTFAGTTFSVDAPDGSVLLAGSFEIDGAGSITWIDSMGDDAGKRLPAIYRFEGDRFVFIAGNEGAPRPTAFRTTAGQTMRTFVRRR